VTLQRTAFIALITLALALALTLVYSGGRMLLAGSYRYQTDIFLDDWATKQSQPTPEAWQVAQQAAHKAVALYPVANGSYYDRLGRVYDWQQIAEPMASPAAQQSRQLAINAYRQAITSWSQWPFSQLALAATKLRQGELDDEFKQALQNGFTLGPWREQAYQQTAYLGLISWHTLNEQQQQTVTNAIHHGLTHTGSSQRHMQQLLTQLQRQDLMAGLVSDGE